METNTTKNIIESLHELFLNNAAHIYRSENGKPAILIPERTKLESVEKFLPQPTRICVREEFERCESFVRYVKKFKNEDSIITGKLADDGARFEAVLDYHGPDKPRWGEHRVLYTARRTVEWHRWAAGNNRPMDQKNFAEFIELNQRDIAAPPGAVMLEMCRTLQAKTQVDFVSGVRLQSGNVQLHYETTTEAKAGEKGALEIPEKFKLGIQVFEGGPRYGQDAFLRYDISEGALGFRYVLDNPHLAMRDAQQQILEEIEEQTGIEAYL